jgi:uncharacterized membrane protein
MSADNVLAIAAMAAATYATRIGGVLIGDRLPRSGRIKQALDALPAAVLTAVITPAATAGRAEMIAAVATILAATRVPMLAALLVGMGTAALLRGAFG